MPSLFKIAIDTGGSFECTTPYSQIYLLSFELPPDNRLTTVFIQAFLLSLDIIEHRYPTGILISTSKIAKFYSNGLDLDHVISTKGFYQDSLFKLFHRLLTYVFLRHRLITAHNHGVPPKLSYSANTPSKVTPCLP